MASGSVYRVSEVVRDLWRRDQDKGVSAGEKRMLEKARQILVSELALAQGLTDQEAGDLLLIEIQNYVVSDEPVEITV
jgi:CarD family transcriptional regulator